MELVKPNGNDSLDMIIRRAVGMETFPSFPKSENSPVQLFQLLNNLERPGWPLLTPLKIQMQNCKKCTREFCSPVNYRRHNRMHRHLRKPEKDFGKKRDALGAFWNKLSVADAKEILSLKNTMLEDVPGASVESGLMNLIEKAGYTALPQQYLKAGSDLLGIIQSRPPRFPISSQELFSILDYASEKTFLSGDAAPMQKYIFDGETGKSILEAKNVVACASFLLEQRLIKAWLADKDAEALRCQNLLVEEEEAARKRQAELLEKKKRKKLRREQKLKDQKNCAKEVESTTSEEQQYPSESSSIPLSVTSDSEAQISDSVPTEDSSSLEDPQVLESTTSEEQQYQAETSIPFSVASDSEAQRSDSVPTEDSSSLEDPQVLEMDNGRNDETQTAMVDDDAGVGNGQNMERRSQSGMRNGFHANHASKLGGMRKNGTNRDGRASFIKVWTQKADNRKSRSPDAEVTRRDQTKTSEVLIGSVSVTIRNNYGEHNQTDSSEEEGRTKTVEAKPTSKKTVKVWRPVSRQGSEVSTVDENADKENNNATAPEVKTSHYINLEFNSHEAKAFLAKRWKDAMSEDHVTLVLSEETEVSASSTNGVITTRPKKLRTKPEKGSKVKYVPKQRSP